jgi:hypothetical protein
MRCHRRFCYLALFAVGNSGFAGRKVPWEHQITQRNLVPALYLKAAACFKTAFWALLKAMKAKSRTVG